MLYLEFVYSISHLAFFEIDENALDDKTVNTTISLGSILALVFGLIGNNEIFAILKKKKKNQYPIGRIIAFLLLLKRRLKNLN